MMFVMGIDDLGLDWNRPVSPLSEMSELSESDEEPGSDQMELDLEDEPEGVEQPCGSLNVPFVSSLTSIHWHTHSI
jgi:hypothetical protein